MKAIMLAAASGRTAGNLDIHLQGRTGLRKSLGLADVGLTIIEGAMGYFDGIANTWINSSYDSSIEYMLDHVEKSKAAG